jgi:hypothetical protein
MGIVLVFASLILTGVQLVVEEKLFAGQTLDPLFVVGCEGLVGLSIFSIIFSFSQNYECTNQLCHNGRLEDLRGVASDFRKNPSLLTSTLLGIIIIAGYNATGVMITKYGSSTQRSTLDTSKTLFVWLIFLYTG